ncbi:MAG: hypothetical protein WDW38_011075 [Sanguina aurantia]
MPFHEAKIGHLLLLDQLVPGTTNPIQMKVFVSLVNSKDLHRNMDGCYVGRCKQLGKACQPVLCDSCPRGGHLSCLGRTTAEAKADLFYCNICLEDAQDMHRAVLGDMGSGSMTVSLPPAIIQAVGPETDVDHLFLVSDRPGGPQQPLFFRNVAVQQGVLTVHLPSAVSGGAAPDARPELGGSRAAARAAAASTASKPSPLSDLISRVAAGVSLVDPGSWRVLRVEDVCCTVCAVTMPQLPLRMHLPMQEMQASPPTDILRLPHTWFQRHYPELFPQPTAPSRHGGAPAKTDRSLSVVVHGLGPATLHLVTNVQLMLEGPGALCINDPRVKLAIQRCVVPAQGSLWLTSLLCSGPGVLDVEVTCVAPADPEAKPDPTRAQHKAVSEQAIDATCTLDSQACRTTLTAAQTPGDEETLPLAWRRLLAAPKAAAVEDPGVLGFFLEVMPEEGAVYARIDVAPVLLSLVEHGRYARPVPLDSKHLSQSRLQPHEQRLAATILGLPQSLRKSRSYARLTGHVGDTLLAEVLDTAPCFLGGLAGLRLSRGKSHPLTWHWLMEPDGSQRLLPLLPNSQRLLRIDSLWYLDGERAAMGLLDAAAEETRWLELPPLKHEHGKRLRGRLPTSRLATRVPLPQVFGELRRSQLAPKPVLTLHALTRHARLGAGTPPLGYARLAFDYAGERLPGRGGEPLVRRVRNGQLVEITRRRADELSAMEQLEHAGLTPVEQAWRHPWPLQDAIQKQTQRRWSQWSVPWQ